MNVFDSIKEAEEVLKSQEWTWEDLLEQYPDIANFVQQNEMIEFHLKKTKISISDTWKKLKK